VIKFHLNASVLAAVLVLPLCSMTPPQVQAADEKKPALSAKDFLKQDAARLYKNEKWADSLTSLEMLEKEYPGDSLVLRYQALALAKMGKTQEALARFQAALKLHPTNAALRSSYAETLIQAGQTDAAKVEYEWISANDKTKVYSEKADTKLGKKPAKKATKKKKAWKVSGKLGWEYNTNIKGVSSEADSRKAGDRNASKYKYGLGGIYNLIDQKHWKVKIDSLLDHSYVDDSWSELNGFVHGVGLTVGYKTALLGKPILYAIRNGVTHSIKGRGKFNNVSDATSFVISYDPWERYGIELSDKLAVNSFKSDGKRPDFTSKDGLVNTISFDQKYIPWLKYKDFYLTLGTGYGHDWTNGMNNVRDVWEVEPGMTIPLIRKATVSTSMGYKRSNYPKFGFPAAADQRRGCDFVYKVELTYPFTKNLKLVGTYTYGNNHNTSDSFINSKHVYGTTLKFSF